MCTIPLFYQNVLIVFVDTTGETNYTLNIKQRKQGGSTALATGQTTTMSITTYKPSLMFFSTTVFVDCVLLSITEIERLRIVLICK